MIQMIRTLASTIDELNTAIADAAANLNRLDAGAMKLSGGRFKSENHFDEAQRVQHTELELAANQRESVLDTIFDLTKALRLRSDLPIKADRIRREIYHSDHAIGPRFDLGDIHTDAVDDLLDSG